MTAAPTARPSSPSVRFTPFVVAVTRNQTHSTNRASGSTRDVSRTNDTACDAGVSPSESGNCTDRSAKEMATNACPISLVRARIPVLRCLKIFR